MSQHDFEIANQGFPPFRSDLNNALQALASNSAGATEPTTTFAYQMWYDDTNDLLKMRNSDDDAWITLAFFNQTTDEWEIRSAVIQAVDSAGVVIKTDDGTTRIEVQDDGDVSIDSGTLFVDAANNRVGVGTTSPAESLDIETGSVSSKIRISGSVSPSANNTIYGDKDGVMIFTADASDEAAGSEMRFSVDGTEAARIDSSQNVFVSKTSSNGNVVGVELLSSGAVFATRDGSYPLFLNRQTSDGELILFRKDGSTVGSISTYGSSVVIGGGDCGVRFIDATNSIAPANVSGNTDIDDSINLGYSSRRFKDLYLSGGVYLGGTGSANYLDDYEEGTWTPTLPNGGTFTLISAAYRKIGDFVVANCYLSAISSIPSDSTQFEIGGLPFTAKNGDGYNGGSLGYVGGANIGSGLWLNPIVVENGTVAYFHRADGNSTSIRSSDATVLNGHALIIQFTYLS